MNKFKKPSDLLIFLTFVKILSCCLFHFSISFKIFKILSRFVFKVSLKPVNKIKFSSPKDPIPTENWCCIYFIPCSSCNLSYIGQRRRPLKAWMDEHRRKAINEEIYSSSIVFHCWFYSHYFDFTKANILYLSISFSHLNFHETFYVLKNSKDIINGLQTIFTYESQTVSNCSLYCSNLTINPTYRYY